MLEELIMLLSSVGLTLFIYGLFSERFLFFLIGGVICCVSMALEEVYLDN